MCSLYNWQLTYPSKHPSLSELCTMASVTWAANTSLSVMIADVWLLWAYKTNTFIRFKLSLPEDKTYPSSFAHSSLLPCWCRLPGSPAVNQEGGGLPWELLTGSSQLAWALQCGQSALDTVNSSVEERRYWAKYLSEVMDLDGVRDMQTVQRLLLPQMWLLALRVGLRRSQSQVRIWRCVKTFWLVAHVFRWDQLHLTH